MKKIVLIALLLCFVSVFGWGVTTYVVDTDGVTGDYASLALAIAGVPATLDDDYIIECQASTDAADTTSVLINKTVGGYTLVIRAASGEEALKTEYSTTRYRLEVTDDECLYTLNPFTVEHLQIRPIYSSATSYGIRVNGAMVGTINVDSCRIDGSGGAGGAIYGIYMAADGDIINVFNTIITNIGTSGTSNIAYNNTAGTLNLYNSIAYGAYFGISNAGTATVKNVASFTNTDDVSDSGTLTIDYCAADDDLNTEFTVGNCVQPSGADWDNEYVDSANGDFTLVASGNCEGGGTDDPGDPLYDTDMDGDSYTSPWSIGVDAKTAAGGVSPSIITDGMRRRITNALASCLVAIMGMCAAWVMVQIARKM